MFAENFLLFLGLLFPRMESSAVNYILYPFLSLLLFISLLLFLVATGHWLTAFWFLLILRMLTRDTFSSDGRWINSHWLPSLLNSASHHSKLQMKGWAWNSIYMKTEEEISLISVQCFLENVSLASLVLASAKCLVKCSFHLIKWQR